MKTSRAPRFKGRAEVIPDVLRNALQRLFLEQISELDKIVAKHIRTRAKRNPELSVVGAAPTSLDDVFNHPSSTTTTVYEALEELLLQKCNSANVPVMRKTLVALRDRFCFDAKKDNAYATIRQLKEPHYWPRSIEPHCSPRLKERQCWPRWQERPTNFSEELARFQFSPPWEQLRAKFSGGAPFWRGVSNEGDDALCDEWDNAYTPDILLSLLEREEYAVFNERRRKLLPVIDALLEDLAMTRTPLVAEREFVERLARMWTSFGFELRLGRGGKTPGAFQELVETALKAYPNAQIQKMWPKTYHSVQVHLCPAVIREVVERLKRRA